VTADCSLHSWIKQSLHFLLLTSNKSRKRASGDLLLHNPAQFTGLVVRQTPNWPVTLSLANTSLPVAQG